MEKTGLKTGLFEPFYTHRRVDFSIVAVFSLINLIVLFNAILHAPSIEYDAPEHINYIKALAQFHFVTPQDSEEFFSPPLAYAIPALVWDISGGNETSALKTAQLFNVILSLGTTYFLLRMGKLVSPNPAMRLGTLAFLGIFPVYYRTFAFVRGEPYVAFFSVLALYLILRIFLLGKFDIPNAIFAGITLGLCALSRQWGIFISAAAFVFMGFQWLLKREYRTAIGKVLVISLIATVLSGAWFFGMLKIQFGSLTSFNREPAEHFSFSNQPHAFYFGLSPSQLFTFPVRPNFTGQLIPVMYEDTWGDYWGYFAFGGYDQASGTFLNGMNLLSLRRQDRPENNYQAMGQYLGKLNLLALFPVFFGMSALFAGLQSSVSRQTEPNKRWAAFLFLLCIAATLAGYFWFLVMYPNLDTGDTIKATYIIQVVPCLALLAGMLFERIHDRSRVLYGLILAGLVIFFVFALPVLITHYSPIFWSNLIYNKLFMI